MHIKKPFELPLSFAIQILNLGDLKLDILTMIRKLKPAFQELFCSF